MGELKLEDIAKLSGVHRSTVSRVVNHSPNVSPEVRERVLRVIESTGYQPNAAARSLASQRSHMIGLVLSRSVSSFFTDPFFPQLTQGVAFGCNNNDLTLSLFLVSSAEDEKKILPRISRRGLLDGILVQAGKPDDRLIEYLLDSNLPTALIGRPFHQDGINYIDVDNISAAARATTHLINTGYKRIAIIKGSSGSTVTVDRLEGYMKALYEHSLPIDESLVMEGDFTEASGYEAMKKLLINKPDAVFASSDIMAAGAIRAAQEAGLRIPADLGVIGFDGLPMSAYTTIPLTTIRQPIMRLGVRAVELLIDIIDNGISPARQIVLETELVVRDSCGAHLMAVQQGRE